jgi:hypothetical protein
MVNNAYVVFHRLCATGKELFSGSDQAVQDDSDNRAKKKLGKHGYSNFGYSVGGSDIDTLMLPRKRDFCADTYEIRPYANVFLRKCWKPKTVCAHGNGTIGV